MIIIPMGKDDLKVDEDLMSVKKVHELRRRIRKVHEDYNEEIRQTNEKINEITTRYSEEGERLVDKNESPTESEEEWKARREELGKKQEKELEEILPDEDDFYQFELAFKACEVLEDMFGQKGKVTQENFDNANWPKIKMELAKLLISNGCDMGMVFLPPKLTE